MAACILYNVLFYLVFYLPLAKYLYSMQYKQVSTLFFQVCLHCSGITGIMCGGGGVAWVFCYYWVF